LPVKAHRCSPGPHSHLAPIPGMHRCYSSQLNMSYFQLSGHDGHTVIRDPEGNGFCVEPGPVGM